jgi:hypothetical protein
MDDKLLNWEDGTQGAFNRCSIPRICAAPPTWGRHSIEAQGWGRAQAPAMNRALVDPGQAARQRFMRMSNTDKLGVAIRQFALRLPAEARAHAMALVDPGNLAIMAGALAIWVGAQATPVGWVVNIAMFGMGVVAIGAEAVDVAREFRDFAVGVLGADDESELRAAVDHLAKATAIVGVDVVVALLLKKATVKVREPKMPVPEGGDSKLLFGKYDPKSAQKRLPPEKAAQESLPARTQKVPAKVDFTTFETQGLKAERIRQGTGDKVAVIGRTMGRENVAGVRDYAQALREKGVNVETFDGKMISGEAQREFAQLTAGGRRLSNAELMQTKMYQENKAWAEKLKSEGYTVIDIGNPYPQTNGFSPFYAVEKQVLFH